ncbi:TPA: glutathione peroxidase [Photobacterium damselae]
MTTTYDFSAPLLSGEQVELSQYAGDVLLIVNTASECGFTHQYQGLQALYDKYHQQGLTILAFPCNQFGGQEPGDAIAIGAFCQKNYGVTFPVFSRIDVKGAQAHPLFNYLISQQPGTFGRNIKWNFTKFLINRDGKPIKRFAPTKTPESIEAEIARLL